MSWRILKPLIGKDLKIFLRDQTLGVMSLLGMAVFIAFYFIMPKHVGETIEIGIAAPVVNPVLTEQFAAEGLVFKFYETRADLERAVTAKGVHLGISLPEDLHAALAAGTRPRVFVYSSSDIPREIKDLYVVMVGEMLGEVSGSRVNIESKEIVLGPDMAGKQIPLRDRILPMLVLMMLAAETLGLAHLITSELEGGTVRALLTTPMRTIDLFVGKGIVGVLLAFLPALFMLIVTGGLGAHAPLIVTSLLLGAMMVTGLAFLIATVTKDLMSVIGWGTLAIIVLSVPAFTAIFPGQVSGWIKMIPSYPLVSIMHRALNYDIGWSGNWGHLIWLTGFLVGFVLLGIFTLKRKVKCVLAE